MNLNLAAHLKSHDDTIKQAKQALTNRPDKSARDWRFAAALAVQIACWLEQEHARGTIGPAAQSAQDPAQQGGQAD